MQILEVNGLRKVYTTRFGGASVEALKNINFSVENGEYVAIMGESGSGKTTLLNILAGLDKPTSGQVLLDGKDLASIRESDRAAFRRDNLGFVFQEFNLLDTFSVEDNIYLPLVLAGKSRTEMRDRLSPLARAIITNPRLLLADEPTGALDSRATDELLRVFSDISAGGQTILMVTHSVRAASRAGRVLFIKDGEVCHQLYRGGMTDDQLYQKITDALTVLQAGGERV